MTSGEVAKNSSVGIATGYGLNGRGEGGSNPGGVRNHTCPDQPWGLHRPLYNVYRVFSLGSSGWNVAPIAHPHPTTRLKKE
jgi:hypothetical protein